MEDLKILLEDGICPKCKKDCDALVRVLSFGGKTFIKRLGISCTKCGYNDKIDISDIKICSSEIASMQSELEANAEYLN